MPRTLRVSNSDWVALSRVTLIEAVDVPFQPPTAWKDDDDRRRAGAGLLRRLVAL